ncbi:MAG: hypothetical protein RRY79_06145 [Clostridia bacterium]
MGSKQEAGQCEVSDNDNFTVNGKEIHSTDYGSANEAMMVFDGGKVDCVYLPLCVAQYLCADRNELHIVQDTWNSLYQMAEPSAQSKLLMRIDQQIAL